ncbi:MAG TPA: SbcC/MukB-like Walker B domain-containing protein [Streptosporangiaceae bacterium]|nr:SbcC/MukB-like Walker B domain-containing protein [Streptosporangiaceae bacterium]
MTLEYPGEGLLPEPSRTDRWQLLRAGVVNLWEFDVAEYWLADGRGQFVGQNQSGKSTLMALTSLILLAGDLDRQLVDTFGQEHKAFRYYVEPTSDPEDRRESGPATSRGWAWLEFARPGDDGPRYFTCLLFAQARRGATGLDHTWAVSASRVRAGLDLHQAAAVRTPSQLAGVPGFRVAADGAEYRSWVARDLFGFTDPGRLDAVVRMLKVLRTPHLGQRLDPGFFTTQMRIALPAVDPAQIGKLAAGWDALDALARDRDHAQTARDAVAGYLAQAWNPWADAVLRGRADQLAASRARRAEADQAAEDAGRAVTTAHDQTAGTAAQLQSARDTLDRVEQGYEDLLTSPAYRDTAGTAAGVEQLQQAAVRSRQTAADTAAEASKSQAALDRRATERQSAIEAAVRAADRVAAAARAVAVAADTAGLPAEAAAWAVSGDVGRLDAAVRQQRQQVTDAWPLLAAAARARQHEEAAARWATQATVAQGRCAARSGQAGQAVDAALQALSDELEGWAAALGDDAPPATQRAEWLRSVSEQLAQPEPQPVLAGLLRDTWLAPQTAALRERAAVHEYRAAERQREARERDDQAAQQLLAEPEPATRFARRTRPPSGPDGTPLWRLLEPREGLAPGVLSHIEAALGAAGLLDAWVTPDGAWIPARDGHDVVLTAATGWPDTTASFSTLASVLHPAPDAGPLASRVGGLLHAIGYLAEENRAPLSYAYGVTADGRWHTPFTAGQAGAPGHGPELIGATTRRDARDRRVQALRDEAAAQREEAAGLRRAGALLREQFTVLETAATRAPGDPGLVRAVLARQAADTELRRAEGARDRADDELAQARAAAQDAHTALLGHAVSTPDATGLDERAGALAAAAAAAAELALARAGQQAAEQAEDQARALYAETAQLAAEAGERASRSLRHADQDQDVADNAEEALDQSGRGLRQAAREQRAQRDELAVALDGLRAEHARRLAEAAAAEVRQAAAGQRAEQAAQDHDAAVAAWWIPVDAGLAAARGVPAAPARTPADAAAQAEAARQLLPVAADGTAPAAQSASAGAAAPEAQVAAAWAAVVGQPLVELRTVLEASGGRGVALLDPASPGQLPAVAILADGAGLASEPAPAVAQLDQQIATLTQRHDQTLDQVLADLLSSTFVEHLQDRQAAVTALIDGVNQVLAQHPTGASATTLRLRRQPAAGHEAAFAVLTALEANEVRTFLEQQIRAAQDQGRTGEADWRQHLAVLLDYRRWFDVVTDYRVGEGSWRPFTEEVHAKDSGGGKAVTLLQPMLAALVALYREPGTAPRPLWLDEAFTGVDDANRATMLALLVTFDLDFLLAGPATLVTTAQVPSAAVWFINRAPAPDPGVDLSLLLWSGDAAAAQPAASSSATDPNTAGHTGHADLTDHSDLTEQPVPRVIS